MTTTIELKRIRETRARRRVVRKSPGVFFVKSTDGTYEHVVVLVSKNEAQPLLCTVDQHDARCWAAKRVAAYLLRNPQRILEAI